MLEIFETEIPQLTGDELRRVYVYVPDQKGCFPVLYMFDGQNVFYDEDASYGKSWGMLEYLEESEMPLIVVGVECNHHDEKENAEAVYPNTHRLISMIRGGVILKAEARSR